jgi:hypothetical protein
MRPSTVQQGQALTVKVLNNLCRAGNATCRKRLMHDDMNETLSGNNAEYVVAKGGLVL